MQKGKISALIEFNVQCLMLHVHLHVFQTFLRRLTTLSLPVSFPDDNAPQDLGLLLKENSLRGLNSAY